MNLADLGRVLETGVSGKILDYAMVLAAVGVIAMALLELLKSLARLRKFYHRWCVQRWTGGGAAYDSLVVLAAGRWENANALFDQPTSKVMGQIQAAAAITLEFPANYPEFFRFITALPERGGANADAGKWERYVERATRGEINKENPQDQQLIREGTQARSRLDHLVARKLDAFQTATEYRWASYNQVASVAIGTGILWYALAQLEGSVPASAYVISILGGLVAPFAKDIVSALSGLRATRT